MLLENKGFRGYFLNTAYLLIEKCIRILLTLVVWAAVIRYLGPEQFGIFSYTLSFAVLFDILAQPI
ncbi:MAG: oligosaccharide flippase family protein [Candidatus Omnitrophica bacterium]|nr:oligosaccharide flippase family protein [Candidatus Omnitrophota bacterium]